jgi:DUF971 family protein
MQRNRQGGTIEMGDNPWPTELRVSDQGRRLRVAFDNHESYDLTAEYLRVESPSAEVQGHSAAERKIVPGKREVRIASATPVGNYAVKLGFDDGHDSGLFSWSYLRQLGQEQPTRWAAYLAALTARGLER